MNFREKKLLAILNAEEALEYYRRGRKDSISKHGVAGQFRWSNSYHGKEALSDFELNRKLAMMYALAEISEILGFPDVKD